MNDQPLTRREARDLERLRDIQTSEQPEVVPTATMPTSFLEPKSLVLDSVPDVTNMSVALPDSGSILTTGSIELPWLKTESGQIQVVNEAATADEAVFVELVDTNTAGISPVAARNHERTRRKASVFPTRLRKGWGVVHLVMISAFLMLALFAGLLAAYLLGIISL